MNTDNSLGLLTLERCANGTDVRIELAVMDDIRVWTVVDKDELLHAIKVMFPVLADKITFPQAVIEHEVKTLL